MRRTLIKFADGPKLRWAAGMLKDRFTTQMDDEKVDKSGCNAIRAQINF